MTGSPTGLHDGASATVAIIYKQATNVLTVPTTAVHRDGSSSYVYVSNNGKKTKTTVKTGLSSGGTTQITSGLKSGQQVYVETITRTRTGGTGTGNTRNGNTRTGGGTSRVAVAATSRRWRLRRRWRQLPGAAAATCPGGGNR